MIGPAAEDWLLNTLRHSKGRLAKACSTVRLISFEGTDATDPQINKPEFGVALDAPKEHRKPDRACISRK
jgi:hypothetical protein